MNFESQEVADGTLRARVRHVTTEYINDLVAIVEEYHETSTFDTDDNLLALIVAVKAASKTFFPSEEHGEQ